MLTAYLRCGIAILQNGRLLEFSKALLCCGVVCRCFMFSVLFGGFAGGNVFHPVNGWKSEKRKTADILSAVLFNKDYLVASKAATAHATVAPTIGLFPIPMSPIISTCAGTEEEPANWASPCILPIESVSP